MNLKATAVMGLALAAWSMSVSADVTVLAVRLGAQDVASLAKS